VGRAEREDGVRVRHGGGEPGTGSDDHGDPHLGTTATFVGYVLGGIPGAVVATVGVFLPAFVFIAASAPLLPRLRRSPTAAAVLDGVNVASLALMAVVTWHLGRASLVDVPTVGMAIVSGALLMTTRINSVWLILGGSAFGLWLAT
jgi:chromate transporter